MTRRLFILTIAFLISLLSIAPVLQAQTAGNGGITTCSAPGATSIGSSAAIGGTYVPVADSAVELNTGVVDYETCVLKPLFNQQRLAADAAYVSNAYQQLSTGRNGNPYWVVNYGKELGTVSDNAFVNSFQNGGLSAINPAFQTDVKRALLYNYQSATRAPQNSYTCPYNGNWQAVITQPTQNFSYDALFAFTNPACDPVYAYTIAQNQMNASVGAAQTEWLNRLNWNNGIYDVRDAQGNVIVPGIFLNAVGTQALTSGFRQLENANDIGQMVGPYFAGVGSMLLSGPSSVANVQTFLNKAVNQQAGSFANSVTSTALGNLQQLQQWNQQYLNAQQQMAAALNTAIGQLQTAENRCWALILPKVCTDTTNIASGQCTSSSGTTLTHVATTTAFSSAVISNAAMSAIASTLQQRITTATSNQTQLQSINDGLNSTDTNARNAALQQLDALIQSNTLFNQSNVTQATNELQQLTSTLTDTTSGTVATAINRWAGNDSSGNVGTIPWNGQMNSDAGWCNINQTQTITGWINAWQ